MAELSLKKAMELESPGGTSFKADLAGCHVNSVTPSLPISMTAVLSGIYWPHIRLDVYYVGISLSTPQNLGHVFDIIQTARQILWEKNRVFGIGKIKWATLDVGSSPLKEIFESNGGQVKGFSPLHGGLPTLCGAYQPQALLGLVPESPSSIRVFVLQALQSSGVSFGGVMAIMIGQACDNPGPTSLIGNSRSFAHELGHVVGLGHGKDGFSADSCVDLEWPLVTMCRKYNLMTQGAATSGVLGTDLSEAQKTLVFKWMSGNPKKVFSMPGFVVLK